MPQQDKQRLIPVDLLRGMAIGLMIIYHFCFDLDYFGYIHARFNSDPFWLNFRALIVSLFLGLVGFSLYLAHHRQWRLRAWAKRLGLLVLAAMAVSLSSYQMYPNSFIFFGILHFITVASLLGPAFVQLGYLNLLLGGIILLVGNHYDHPFFNQPAWQWVGMMTERPITEDYVPLFPWFGMVLVGIGLGHWSKYNQFMIQLLQWRRDTPLITGLTFAGRHSLLIYLLHQPILLGLLYLITKMHR